MIVLKHTRRILLIAMAALLSTVASAQQLKIGSAIDTSQIHIGDQVAIVLSAEVADSAVLRFPIFKDTLVTGVEIISAGSIDTLSRTGGMLSLRQRLIVTAFDTGAFMLPAGPFVTSNGDTAWGAKMFLSVNTFEVDTTQGPVDIKMPYSAPITFDELLPYILIGLLILALIGAGVYGYLYWARKQMQRQPVIVIPSDPPHIIAYRELDRLKEQKLWQQEKYKLYYSCLGDVLRQYIEHKFGIPALEQTSDELLKAVQDKGVIKHDSLALLQTVLQTADLAKFAKAQPGAEENELNFKHAFDFVSQSKLIGIHKESEGPEPNQEQ